MKSEPKKYTVSILGAEYTLVSDESQEHINRAAQSVDDLMRQLGSRAQGAALERIAVLSALCLASDLMHERTKMQEQQERENRLISAINAQVDRVKEVL